MRPKHLVCLLASLLYTIWGGVAESTARERILNLSVAATVRDDASIRVRESVRVKTDSAGARTFTRTFPAYYVGDGGSLRRSGFSLLAATLDGRAAGVGVERGEREVYLRLSPETPVLAAGVHTYEIVYDITGCLFPRETQDALRWNVTGNAWGLPVERVSVSVDLPGAACFSELTVFSGFGGAFGRPLVPLRDGSFATDVPLEAGNAVWFSASMDKGIVDFALVGSVIPPSLCAGWRRYGALLSFLGILSYYLCVWYRKGRDPYRFSARAAAEPPEGIEPGFAGYLVRMRYTKELFVADILELGVRGSVELADGDGGLRLLPTEKTVGRVNVLHLLPSPLRAVAETLFSGCAAGGITLGGGNGVLLKRAMQRQKEAFRLRARRFFLLNQGYSAAGVLLFLPLVFSLAAGANVRDSAVPAAVLALFPLLLALRPFHRYPVLVLGGAFCIFYAWRYWQLDTVLFLSYCASATAAYVFGRLMPARTREGARVASELAGLLLFLKKPRANAAECATDAPAYARLLPYACALGALDDWCGGLAACIEAAGAEPSRAQWDRMHLLGAGGTNVPRRYAEIAERLSRNVRRAAEAAPIS